MSRSRRNLVTLCYLLGLALVVPGAAWAHATLTGTSPSFQQRLPQSPRFVQLRFDQSVKAFPNAITVYTVAQLAGDLPHHGRL